MYTTILILFAIQNIMIFGIGILYFMIYNRQEFVNRNVDSFEKTLRDFYNSFDKIPYLQKEIEEIKDRLETPKPDYTQLIEDALFGEEV